MHDNLSMVISFGSFLFLKSTNSFVETRLLRIPMSTIIIRDFCQFSKSNDGGRFFVMSSLSRDSLCLDRSRSTIGGLIGLNDEITTDALYSSFKKKSSVPLSRSRKDSHNEIAGVVNLTRWLKQTWWSVDLSYYYFVYHSFNLLF